MLDKDLVLLSPSLYWRWLRWLAWLESGGFGPFEALRRAAEEKVTTPERSINQKTGFLQKSRNRGNQALITSVSHVAKK